MGINNMDVQNYTITDSFISALNTICKHCGRHDCFACEIFDLRINSELYSAASKNDHLLERCKDVIVPDSFAFKTKTNQLTEHRTYYAQRDEDQYTVTLPSIGCTYHFSVEHMQRGIMEKRYVIVAVNA